MLILSLRRSSFSPLCRTLGVFNIMRCASISEFTPRITPTAARLVAVLAVLLTSAPVWAHFVFVVPQGDGKTSHIIMSETLAPDDAVNISIIKDARFVLRELDGSEQPLTFESLDAAQLRMATPGKGTRVVRGKVDLGLTERGSVTHVLLYHPKTILGDAFDARTVIGSVMPVELVPVKGPAEGEAHLKLLVEGKPRRDAEVTVIHPDGASEKMMTNKEGLTPVLTQTGRHGAWARYWEEKPGARDEKKFSQVRHYATLVFDFPKSPQTAAAVAGKATAQFRDSSDAALVERFTDLPYATSSFGAVVCNGWLYVYGGHITPTHEYHTASGSGQFHRLDLSERKTWQVLHEGPRLQGMNLTTCDGAIYRMGGMQSINNQDDEVDNRSTAQAARFDPANMTWSDIAPLPEPRSSHDVVESGGRLYVLGGWHMRGKGEKPRWLDYMDVLDLAATKPHWVRVPQPFHRRALIAAVLDRRIYAIGGFDEHSNPSMDVDIYDLGSGVWSKGPPLPQPSRNGFAPAAGVLDRTLYVSVSDGSFCRLAANESKWERVASTTPRIVHRVVPFGSRLLVVGGAAEGDNLALIESVRPERPTGIAKGRDANQSHGDSRVAPQAAAKLVRVRSSPSARDALAAGQRSCPIMTDEKIDEDSPAVEYRGRTIALCCEGCVRRWKRDPDAYAAASIEMLPQLAGQTIPPRKLKQVYCPVFTDRVVSEHDIKVDYQGQTVYLFSQEALRQWKADPEKYAASSAP